MSSNQGSNERDERPQREPSRGARGQAVARFLRRGRSSRRRFLGSLVGLIVIAGVGISAREVEPAVAGPGADNPDYAVEWLHDAWDYSNPEDQVVVEGQSSVGILNSSIANGELRFDINGPSYFHPLWGGYPDAQPANRDGAVHPIDSGRFTRLVMKVTASRYTPAGLRWYTCLGQNASCEGGQAVTLEAGTHTYDINLNNDGSGGGTPWGGSRPISLRMLFSPYGPTSIGVDWMRLTGPTAIK